jgi:hypothetical protein
MPGPKEKCGPDQRTSATSDRLSSTLLGEEGTDLRPGPLPRCRLCWVSQPLGATAACSLTARRSAVRALRCLPGAEFAAPIDSASGDEIVGITGSPVTATDGTPGITSPSKVTCYRAGEAGAVLRIPTASECSGGSVRCTSEELGSTV